MSDYQLGVSAELRQIFEQAVEEGSFGGLSELSHLAMIKNEKYLSAEV